MPDRILTSRLAPFTSTIFTEMSALALRTGAVNLGQGFPDTDGPAEVVEAAVAALRGGHNQYAAGPGVLQLRAAVAEHQRRFYGIDLDPDTQVAITFGATEGIAASVLALCEPGDEVITLEPWYDSYAACVSLAGATRRVVRLEAPDFVLDADALARAVSPATRLVLINSPHNPTGRVLSETELAAIARVCVDHDLLAVTDEVYEHLVFDGRHIPLATLPGMAERTLTVSSHGKTFSFTGWKIGWVTGPPALVAAAHVAKQYLTFHGGTPLQHAAAVALALPDEFYAGIVADLRAKRDRLCAGLAEVGFTVFPPQGTFFVVTDAAPLGAVDGIEFCLSLPERVGVVAVPMSVFYDDRSAARTLVRFAFPKGNEVLDEGLARLKGLASGPSLSPRVR
ncbi:MAG: pyridoxal phosphate-dependent aminotransferase [Acidimicrobiia bacterium]